MNNIDAGVQITDGPKQHYGERAASKPEAPPKPRSTRSSNLYAPATVGTYELLFFLLVAAVLIIGWQVRNEEYLTAESGLGYALGIVGSVLMLLLLLYALRKRVRLMQEWGSTKYWFQAHMIMGVLGPALILFHSNFQVASLNSTVALVSMLLVAASGFVGRYIYTKIHYGLYGSQICLKELKEEIEGKKNDSVLVLGYAPEVKERLLAFDTAVLRPPHSFLQSVWHCLITKLRAPWTYFVLLLELRRTLEKRARHAGWSPPELQRKKREARRYISAHMTTAVRIAELSVFERMFAAWHVIHLPLTYLLVIAVVVHIIAVHMY